MKLEMTRKEINKVDEEIVKAIEKRNILVKNVIEYKIENEMEIYDKNREDIIYKKISGLVSNDQNEEYILEIFKTIIEESKKYQKEILENRLK